jgi:propionate catabolism operon transcriptional regulator
MDGKIGIIASDRELEKAIKELYKKEVENGEILIDILDAENIESQGRMLERRGAKAIIARSGGYRHTVGRVSVPVIHLKITTMDILQAIKKASGFNKDIILLISDIEYFDYEEWKDILNREIIIERFHSKDEIQSRVESYADSSEKIVIVGGGIPCSAAQSHGMDYVHIGASKESIYEGVARAKELIKNLHEQKYQNELLKTVMDGVHDAVIAVNQEGRVILYNEIAQKLLRKNSEDVMDKHLLEACPELKFLLEVLKSKVSRYNEIKHLNRIVITANTSLLKVDGQVQGVLCSFQDITKLQSLEKKIRYELNKKGLVARYRFHDIMAQDKTMKDTVAKAIRIAGTDSTVMLYGESGTGKEVLAQSIHNLSSRQEEPFVVVNCAAISESLLESELFGYEEGAFTGARKGGKPGLFELAHGGTIFLDEINSISPNLQGKLLRVLEEKEVMRLGSDYVIPLDVRVIAAANENLKKKVKEGSFRSDLFYRLSILELHIPPLRERKKDIVPLFNFFVKALSKEAEVQRLSPEMEAKLISFSWPGNVRELKNAAQRYVIFNELELGEGEEQETAIELREKEIVQEVSAEAVINLKDINRFVEEKVIEMLTSQGMNKTEIAKTLGISRTALWKKSK